MTEADIIDLRQLVVGMNPATRLLIDDKERGEHTHMVMGFWKPRSGLHECYRDVGLPVSKGSGFCALLSNMTPGRRSRKG